MAQLVRTVASNAFLVINRSPYGLPAHIRTFFSSASIGLDNFKLAREQHASRHAPSLDAFKKRFLDSINSSDIQIFTEDLRNMIMSADNDGEIDAVIQALRKYNANKLKFTEFHFGSPIMRLLYLRNKTDLAMQLFTDEELKDIFRDSGSSLILLNKLLEEQRYDDVIKMFEYASQRGFSTASGRTYPTDVVMLTIEALYKQNTKQSLAKAKEIISTVMAKDSDVNPRTASLLALLAIQQGEPSFATEILGAVRSQNLTTIQNIRAICYADMGRIEEAINVVHLLADQPPIDNDRRRVFPLVLQHIQQAAEKSKDQDMKSRFEDLRKFVSANNRLSTTDLHDFIDEPINRRGAVLPNRPGVQQNTGGNMRDTGYRGGFNQQPNTFRQGFGGGGNYNRDNRFQSNRFSSNENNPFQQRNQSSVRSNRIENTPSARPRERGNEQNSSRRTGNQPGPMATTATSPIPQRVTETNDGSRQKSRQNRNFNPNDNKSSLNSKQEERQTGANTGSQQQSPWDQDGQRSA